MILVDTSVWIDYLNGCGSLEADFLTLCIAELRPVVLPGLVLTETLQGVRDAPQAELTRSVLGAFSLAPELERSDYEQAAEIYRACRAGGSTPRPAIDCLIAQLCLRYDYELLTRDRDFDAIGKRFPLKRIRPSPGVQERAEAYRTPDVPPTHREATIIRRGDRKPWEQLRALGGEVHAAPGESVLKDKEFKGLPFNRQRASAPPRSSPAPAPRSRGSPR